MLPRLAGHDTGPRRRVPAHRRPTGTADKCDGRPTAERGGSPEEARGQRYGKHTRGRRRCNRLGRPRDRFPGHGQTREPEQPEECHRYRGLVTAENRVDLITGERWSEAGPVPDAQDDIPVGGIGRVQIEIDRRLGCASLPHGIEERVVLCPGARGWKDAAVESELPGSRESGSIERSLNLVIDGAEMGEV